MRKGSKKYYKAEKHDEDQATWAKLERPLNSQNWRWKSGMFEGCQTGASGNS